MFTQGTVHLFMEVKLRRLVCQFQLLFLNAMLFNSLQNHVIHRQQIQEIVLSFFLCFYFPWFIFTLFLLCRTFRSQMLPWLPMLPNHFIYFLLILSHWWNAAKMMRNAICMCMLDFHLCLFSMVDFQCCSLIQILSNMDGVWFL